MNKRRTTLMLALIFTLSCGVRTVDDRRSLEHEVDPNIKPGDDFFAYANGSWLKSTEIPAGKERWNARNEISELTRRQVAQLFDNAGAAPAGSTERKVADFRAAYLNENAIESRGLTPLTPLLDSIDRVGDKTSLTQLLGRGLRADVDWGVYRSSNVLGLSVIMGNFGEKNYVAFLMQGGLGLPDREYYLSAEAPMRDLRLKYREYIGLQLKQAGFDRAEQRSEAVMALETLLAKAQATREASDNDRNAANLWTRADFERKAPGMDWSLFFSAAGLAHQESFAAWQPGAVTGLAALVASQPLDTWKDYMRFHVLDAYADVLPRAFSEPAAAMHTAVTNKQPGSRTQRALEVTQDAMGDAIGRMYADRYFPAKQKLRVEAIVQNVIEAFRKRVEAVTWMSQSTKMEALAKLKTLYFGIGYPKTWQNYSGLVVDSTDAIGNLRRIADRNYLHTLARLGQPAEVTDWWITPQTAGAVLLFQQNSYNFTAALLQAPKFDSTLSDAANYGAIGAIVGHEVSHFVDLLGAEWDADRRLRHWWNSDDLSGFQAAADALVDQYSGYHPLTDVAVNGKLTRTENVADLAGLAAAFEAYRNTLGEKIKDKAYVRQQDREFFMGFAQSWRGKISEKGLRALLASDGHAPESYRIATVRNMDAWYDAFDVQPGQKLYLEPKARVRVW